MNNPRLALVLAMDEEYFKKACLNNTFKSIKANWPYRVCVLTIGFDINDRDYGFQDGWEFAHCALKDLFSYRTDWPKNRPFYVCAEGGEFLNYFEFEDDEIIVHIDADMVMQRRLSAQEINELVQATKGNQVASTFNSYPIGTLDEERVKIGGKEFSLYDQPVFNCGLICCRAQTYEILCRWFNQFFEDVISKHSHHATGQYLINWITHIKLKFHPLPGYFSCGAWFHNQGEITIQHGSQNGNPKTIDVSEGGLLYFQNEIVIFNHNKFRNPKGYCLTIE